MMYANHMDTGGWVVSIIGTLIIVVLIVTAVVWLASHRSVGPDALAGSAGEILDRRLARGEVTSEQYDELRHTLATTASSGTRPASPANSPG
jgi:uncharacterized membrane protein